MLFSPKRHEVLALQWEKVIQSRNRAANLWRGEWQASFEDVVNSYKQATGQQSPEAWDTVCSCGRQLRGLMRQADGHEAALYADLVELTDTIESALDEIASKDPSKLVPRGELREVLKRLRDVEARVTEERQEASSSRRDLRVKLDKIDESLKSAKRPIVKIDEFSLVSFGVDELISAIKDGVIAIKNALELLDDPRFTEQLRSRAKKLWEATQGYGKAVRRRFEAFRIPFPRDQRDDYFEKIPENFVRDFFSKRKIADMDKKISGEAKKGYNDLMEAYAKLPCPNGIDRESPRSILLGLTSGKPLLEGHGFLDISEDIAASSKKISDTLRRNEEMGFLDLDEPIEWRGLPLRIPYYQHHFSTFLAAREAGLTLSPITAGALICCSETKEVVYMKRSRKVHTFPAHYHHFGGGFKASTDLERFDGDDLFETAQRKIREETGCRIDEEHFQAASMLLEGGTGYFQYLFLGVDISKEQRQRMKHSEKGVLVNFKFDELGEALASEPFVPTCILQTMIWLMLGAPTSSNKKFSAKTARRQYKFLMEHFGMA